MVCLKSSVILFIAVALFSNVEAKEEEINSVKQTHEDYWLTYTTYSGTSCSGTPVSASAYKMNTCIKQGTSSYVYYTVVDDLVQQRSYSSSTCSGAFNSETISKECDAYGTKGEMVTGQPNWQGFGSIQTDTGCGIGSPVVIYLNQFLDACLYRTKYVYHQGDMCLKQIYQSDTCVGTPTSVQAVQSNNCYSSNPSTQAGCVINNAILSPEYRKPTFSNSARITKRFITKCEDTPVFTTYEAVPSCDGEGTRASIIDSNITFSSYDKYDCTGTLFQTESKLLKFGCSNSTSPITSKSVGVFPNTNSLVGFSTADVDSCSSPTTVSTIRHYTPSCVNTSSIFTPSSQITLCSSNTTNITVSVTTYNNDVCSSLNNATVSTNTIIYPLCSDDYDGTPVKFSCVLSAYSSISCRMVVSWVAFLSFLILVLHSIAM